MLGFVFYGLHGFGAPAFAHRVGAQADFIHIFRTGLPTATATSGDPSFKYSRLTELQSQIEDATGCDLPRENRKKLTPVKPV